MQTFLPYPDVIQSAECLDYRRLGKQRVEAFQILNTLNGYSTGWANHPAVIMWRSYEPALQLYCNAMIREWVRRGYKNTMSLYPVESPGMPEWFGDERLHSSHRANLLRKDPSFYGKFGWVDDPTAGYFWPGLKNH